MLHAKFCCPFYTFRKGKHSTSLFEKKIHSSLQNLNFQKYPIIYFHLADPNHVVQSETCCASLSLLKKIYGCMSLQWHLRREWHFNRKKQMKIFSYRKIKIRRYIVIVILHSTCRRASINLKISFE